jgi:hypothetical protein
MKIKFVLLFILSTINLKSYSQVKISNLKDECHTENAFPFAESSGNPIVAEKINILLQVKLLEIVPGAYKKCAFEKVMSDTANCCSYVFFSDYTVTKNTKTIVSLSMQGETMGAYPENASWNYNFNAVTGDVIFPEEIFTATGYATLKKKITAHRRKRLNDFLDGLSHAKSKDPDDIELANDQREIYENCLPLIDDENFFYGSFLIKDDKLIFIRERCSNHAMRAVDDLDEFYDEVLVKDIYKELNDYGKALFSEDVASLKKMTPSITFNKILKGTINNKTPITCIFNTPYLDSSLVVNYWYDQHKTIIEWSGKVVNGKKLELIEYDYHDEALHKWISKALIEAEIKDNTIIGFWKDQRNGNNLPLRLVKYE